jgi:hypothetical protein
VHLSPGSFHSEYQADDVSPCAIYDNSINVFAFNQMGRDIDDIGHSFANYVRLAWPDFRPQRILDASLIRSPPSCCATLMLRPGRQNVGPCGLALARGRSRWSRIGRRCPPVRCRPCVAACAA